MLKRICLSFFLYFHAKHAIKFCPGQQGMGVRVRAASACACACIIIKNKRKEKGKKHTYYIIGKKKKLIIKLEFKDV